MTINKYKPNTVNLKRESYAHLPALFLLTYLMTRAEQHTSHTQNLKKKKKKNTMRNEYITQQTHNCFTRGRLSSSPPTPGPESAVGWCDRAVASSTTAEGTTPLAGLADLQLMEISGGLHLVLSRWHPGTTPWGGEELRGVGEGVGVESKQGSTYGATGHDRAIT